MAAVRQLDVGRAEARVRDDARAERVAEGLGRRDRVALHHEVELVGRRAADQGVAHDAAHRADIPGQGGWHPRHQGMRPHGGRRAALGSTTWPTTRSPASSPPSRPVADGPARALRGFEGLTLAELQEAFDGRRRALQAWVKAPGNEGRPISEAPDYMDRIALDSLLERRTWSE